MKQSFDKVIFLDIDGVLNRCRISGQGLETDKVELLATIVRTVNPVIVVSSTWRMHSLDRVIKMLVQIGARYGGHTPYQDKPTDGGLYIAKFRGQEIQEWIDANGSPGQFVILDDDPEMWHLTPYLIKTESFVGLTPTIAQKVIDTFNKGTTNNGYKVSISTGGR